MKSIFTGGGVPASRVFVIGEGVDPAAYSPGAAAAALADPAAASIVQLLYAPFPDGACAAVAPSAWQQPRSRFAGAACVWFVSVFKWEARKNWAGLLTAFARQFAGPDIPVRACLLIKTSRYLGANPHAEAAVFLETLNLALNAKYWLRITTDELSSGAMVALYRRARAFVLLSHGEGWGLPALEAMATGTPAIVTGWGGSLAFAGGGCALLVDVEAMVPSAIGSYARWASPDLNHAGALMRRMAEDVRPARALRARVR